jgi:putative transposase
MVSVLSTEVSQGHCDWVFERSFAWIIRWRRLARDHEGLPESSEAFIKLSASRRMLSHLAPLAA